MIATDVLRGEPLPPLDHQHACPAFRQDHRGNTATSTSADHDNVVAVLEVVEGDRLRPRRGRHAQHLTWPGPRLVPQRRPRPRVGVVGLRGNPDEQAEGPAIRVLQAGKRHAQIGLRG